MTNPASHQGGRDFLAMAHRMTTASNRRHDNQKKTRMTTDVQNTTAAGVTAHDWGRRHATRKDFALRRRRLHHPAGGAGAAARRVRARAKATLMAGLAGVLGGDDEGEQEGSLHHRWRRCARGARSRADWCFRTRTRRSILERLGDDAAFGCENLNVPREEIWQRVRESLDMVGTRRTSNSTGPPAHLSGGQRQRLALAGVLAMKPGLLLLGRTDRQPRSRRRGQGSA